MCLSNEGLSHQETSEMVRRIRVGKTLGELYVAATHANDQDITESVIAILEATEQLPIRYSHYAFGFNSVMKKYHLKVRA